MDPAAGMEVNPVGKKIKLAGVYQGTNFKDGVPGRLANFLSLEDVATGRVLNIEISDESMQQILAFSYTTPGQSEEPTQSQEEVPTQPEPGADIPEPVEADAPASGQPASAEPQPSFFPPR